MMKTPIYETTDAYGIPVYVLDKNAETQRIISSLVSNGTYAPEIEHVTFNTGMKTDEFHIDPKTGKKVIDKEHEVKTTVVDFDDNTRAVVTCSANDTFDKTTGIVNAIVKRLGGKPDKNGLIDGNGVGNKLNKIVKGAWDQQEQEANAAKFKAETKAKHLAKQSAEHEAAYAKKVNAAVRDIKILIDALAAIGIDVNSLSHTCKCGCETKSETNCKTVLNENHSTGTKTKFKDMTQDQKRAYWREAKRKNKA